MVHSLGVNKGVSVGFTLQFDPASSSDPVETGPSFTTVNSPFEFSDLHPESEIAGQSEPDEPLLDREDLRVEDDFVNDSEQNYI